MSTTPGSRSIKNLGWLLLAVAVMTRILNALSYKTGLGFDAVENVEYIELLMQSWELPAPDEAWATSHPPLFYYFFALVGRLLAAFGQPGLLLQTIPLLGGAASIATALLAASAVRRMHPGDEARALIALALVLFLPVQIYLSAMVNEEVMAALLVSIALWLALVPKANGDPRKKNLLQAAATGFVAGLAMLTKLSGVLVVVAIGCAWLIQGLRTRSLGNAIGRVLTLGGVALCIGGWFYLRNYFVYGYFYPQDLSVHAIMFEMPPGERGLLDYFSLPLATWSDPQLLNPDLMRSVWGSTYATLYFDGHRHFLAHSVDVSRMGSLLLILALLPVGAFAAGLCGGLRRAFSGNPSYELPLLWLIVLSLAGYVVFTWSNPWFVTLKAGYLLGLSIPFAWYASDPLARWISRPGAKRWIVTIWLGMLALLISLTFTTGLTFYKLDGPGLPWRATLGTP